MSQNKMNEMLMHSIVSLRAEVMSLKDLLLDDLAARGKLTEDQRKFIEDSYQKGVYNYQTRLLAQIRAKYDTTLGDVDDLLKSMK